MMGIELGSKFSVSHILPAAAIILRVHSNERSYPHPEGVKGEGERGREGGEEWWLCNHRRQPAYYIIHGTNNKSTPDQQLMIS